MWSKLRMNEVFPLPERPQIATFSPAAMAMERFLRIG
jgi:hypothetical protein